MATVHCPRSKSIREMDDCVKCFFKSADGISSVWCTYRGYKAKLDRKEDYKKIKKELERRQ